MSTATAEVFRDADQEALFSATEKAIREGSEIARAVAERLDQPLAAVGRSQWFRDAVAEEIIATDPRFAHLSDSESFRPR